MPGYGSLYGVGPYGYDTGTATAQFLVVGNIDDFVVRVNFNETMTNDADLRDPTNYLLDPLSGGVDIVVRSVTPQSGVTFPKYVDLEVSELTGEAGDNSYRLTIVSGALRTSGGQFLNSPDNIAIFNAIPFRPKVLKSVPISAFAMDIEFDEEMENTVDLRDPNSYVFTGGLKARIVSVISATKVRVFVTPAMAVDQLYSVTVG